MAVALGALFMASPAYAGDTGSASYLMTADDLRGDFGPVRESFTNDLGRVLPSSCDVPSSGSGPVGRASVSAPFSEVDFADGHVFQNTVYLYRTPSAARASFTLLESRTLAKCRGAAYTPFGDDEEIVPQVSAAGARRLPPVGGDPRFSFGQSLILLDPTSAPPGYTDEYGYGVYTLVDNAIVQMQAYSTSPISAATRADLRRVNEVVSRRFAEAAD